MKDIDDIKGDEEEEAEREEFWRTSCVPYNDEWQENGLDFVNPVTVADQFIKAAAQASRTAYEAEIIAKHVAEWQDMQDAVEHKLLVLRRKILAENYDKITKSATPEIQNAFILKHAGKHATEMQEKENELETIVREIGAWKPYLAKLDKRLRRLERNMDWATQYLNFDKHIDNINKKT